MAVIGGEWGSSMEEGADIPACGLLIFQFSR
jgi:hypothetical protein